MKLYRVGDGTMIDVKADWLVCDEYIAIFFDGWANGKRADFNLKMNPTEALALALMLIRSADSHSKRTKRSVQRLAMKLNGLHASGGEQP